MTTEHFITGHFLNDSKLLGTIKNRNYVDMDFDELCGGVNPYEYADIFLNGSCDLCLLLPFIENSDILYSISTPRVIPIHITSA